MAAITSAAVGAVTAGASLYMSARQANDGKKQAEESKKAIEDYNRQKLTNPYENLKVSTLGANVAREEAARNYASAIDAMKMSGSSGAGMLPAYTSSYNALNQRIGAGLDQQFIANENQKAFGNSQRMQMQEQREVADLAGLGNAMWVGQQNQYTGIQNTLSTAPIFADSVDKLYNTIRERGKGVSDDEMLSNKIKPQGLVPVNNQPSGGLLPWTNNNISYLGMTPYMNFNPYV